MEITQYIFSDIEEITRKEVTKVGKLSILGIILIIAGIISFFLGLQIDIPESTVAMLLYSIGFTIALVGIIKLFIGKKYFSYRPTNSKLKEVTKYFEGSSSSKFEDYIQNKKFSEIKNIRQTDNNGLKVDAMLSEDGAFAAVQLSTYIPYEYAPITNTMLLYGNDAKEFTKYFN